MTSTRAVLLLGSNVSDSRLKVSEALRRLQSLFSDVSASGIYPSEDVTGCGAAYHNAVVALSTDLTVPCLTALCKSLEAAAGRTAADKANGIVPLDIDVVVYDGHLLRDADYNAAHFRRGYEEIRQD